MKDFIRIGVDLGKNYFQIHALESENGHVGFADERSIISGPIEKGFRDLHRIGLDEASIRLRQVEAGGMQLHPHAADDADAFAEIDLGMAGPMRKRDEKLARPGVRQADVILHDHIAASKAVFDPQPFENPLRRMPLFGRRRLVGLQDRIDHRNQRPELRPLRGLGPHIAGRRRIPALTRQAITKHLRVLENAGLVSSTRVGRESQFAFRSEPIVEIRSYLDNVSQQWDDALSRLRSHVERWSSE
jgi:hypothetical protein